MVREICVLEPGDRVQIVEGAAAGSNAVVRHVYVRWYGFGAYVSVETDKGERHFEKVSNLRSGKLICRYREEC